MNLRFVTGPGGRTKEIDLTGPRLLLATVLVVGIFIAGLALGRFLLGASAEHRAYARAVAQQKTDLQAARGQIDGKV
ncbi:MAG: hypothetical protein NTU56_02170, partial [Proteobacteria bacterium]|nr:hypothetical protein [Pseudomonadota bacterium]